MSASKLDSADSEPGGKDSIGPAARIRIRRRFFRREPDLVLVLVGVVLSAAIVLSVSLFLSLWLFPSKVECTSREKMIVTFGPLSQGGNSPGNLTVGWHISDLGCGVISSFQAWQVNLLMDMSYQYPNPYRTLSANTIIPLGPSEKLIVTDDGNGMLSIGDGFLVYGMEEFHDWQFTLIKPGYTAQYASWSTPRISGTQPTIDFSQASTAGTPPYNCTATWTVTSTSAQIYEIPYFRATLARESFVLTTTPQRLAAGGSVSLGAEVHLFVSDPDGNGNLTTGDGFLVHGLSDSHSWNLSLLWSAREVRIASARWSTFYTRPSVAFSAVSRDGSPPLNYSANWTVTSASTPLFGIPAYYVEIYVDGNLSGWENLSAGVILWLGPSRMIVRSSGTHGLLDIGTSFLIYSLTAPHDWRLSLRWKMDGSEVLSASWSTP